MKIIIVADEMDMLGDFYVKHNMQVIELQLNKFINKDKNLIKKLPPNYRYSLNRKFERYRV